MEGLGSWPKQWIWATACLGLTCTPLALNPNRPIRAGSKRFRASRQSLVLCRLHLRKASGQRVLIFRPCPSLQCVASSGDATTGWTDDVKKLLQQVGVPQNTLDTVLGTLSFAKVLVILVNFDDMFMGQVAKLG